MRPGPCLAWRLNACELAIRVLQLMPMTRYVAFVGAVGVLAIAFLLLGPPQLLAKSESPEFCSGCHVMEAEFEAWSHAGAHRRKQCVDCHLPHENVALHYVWKSLDGAKDVVLFYSGAVPERIQLSSHGKEVLQSNCIRCHASTVASVNPDRTCWECHRRLMHRRSGAIATS